MHRGRQFCFGNSAQVLRRGGSCRAVNQACYPSRAFQSSYIAQVRLVASAGGLCSVSEPFVAFALSPQFSRLGVRASTHGHGAGRARDFRAFDSQWSVERFRVSEFEEVASVFVVRTWWSSRRHPRSHSA